MAVLGGALPDQRFQEVADADRGERFANQRFGLALLRALKCNGALPFQVSAAPATDYPNNRSLMFKRLRHHWEGIDFLEVPFVNLTGIKHVTRTLAAIIYGIPEMRRHDAQVVVVHGILSPFLATALLARHRLGVPAAVVVTDPPNVDHAFDTKLSRALKRIDARIIRRLLPSFDGVIAVTEQIVQDFTQGSRSLIMEGFATELSIVDESHEGRRPLAVYAGGVKAAFGVDVLLQAQGLPGAGFDLAVYGAGPFVDEVVAAQKRQPGVMYGGVLDLAGLMDAYASADVLVNARPPDLDYAPYTFPSKLLEYLATGKPVVSTRLPGIPEDYWQVLIPCEPTAESVAAAIALAAAQQTPEARARRLAFVASRTPSVQGRRIVEFLEALRSPMGVVESV